MAQNAKPIILWDNLLAGEDVNLYATSSADGHSVENLADWREYLTWQGSQTGTHSIIADLGSARSVSAFCLYGHNFKTADISSITFYGSTNGADWAQIFSENIDSDLPILKVLAQAVEYRYYKIEFTAGNTAPEISLWFIGAYLEFPIWLSAGFDPNNQEVSIEESASADGYLLGVVENYRKRKLTVEFNYISDSWVRNNFFPFWDAHIPVPFLFAWDYQNHPRETYLVQISKPVLEVPYNPIYRTLRLELEGRAG